MSRTYRRNHLERNKTRYVDHYWKHFDTIYVKENAQVSAERKKKMDEEFDRKVKERKIVLIDGVYYDAASFNAVMAPRNSFYRYTVAIKLTEQEARKRASANYDKCGRDHRNEGIRANVKYHSKKKVRRAARIENHHLMSDVEHVTVPHERALRGEIWNWD